MSVRVLFLAPILAALLLGCDSSSNKPTALSSTVLPDGLSQRPELPPLVAGQAAACVPACTNGRTVPQISAGPYQTHWFFGGYMTLTFDSPWSGVEDSAGEFKVRPPGGADYGVSFSLDNFLVRDKKEVADVPRTAQAWIDWHRQEPRLVVSTPVPATVGGIKATAIDVRLSPTATKENADCPASCVDLWGNTKFGHYNGILGDDVYRLYLADVTYSGSNHLLLIIVETQDAAHLKNTAPAVEQLLTTVRFPVTHP
jgi:hypothetical protein